MEHERTMGEEKAKVQGAEMEEDAFDEGLPSRDHAVEFCCSLSLLRLQHGECWRTGAVAPGPQLCHHQSRLQSSLRITIRFLEKVLEYVYGNRLLATSWKRGRASLES